MLRLSRLAPAAAVALLAVGLAVPRPAAAQVAPGAEPSRLFVTGQGVVSARPDVALVTMGAVVRRDTANEAFERANTLMNGLNDILRGQGIAERDVTTRQFNLTPEFGRPPDGGGPAPIVAWRATQLLSIKIRDFTRIGPVIDAGARLLGNDAQISGISFTVENTDAVTRQARDAAIANARERASQIAEAAGVRLVRIVSISESSAPPPTPQQFNVGVAAAAPAPARQAPEVAPGEQNLTVTVQITYEIA